MSSLVRRIVARFGLAIGIGALAAAALSEGGGERAAVEVVIDLRPVADAVRGARVDLVADERSLGGVERRFDSAAAVRPIRIEIAPPGERMEISLELDTAVGPRRARRSVTAPTGSTVVMSVDGLEPATPP